VSRSTAACARPLRENLSSLGSSWDERQHSPLKTVFGGQGSSPYDPGPSYRQPIRLNLSHCDFLYEGQYSTTVQEVLFGPCLRLGQESSFDARLDGWVYVYDSGHGC
jgi:hypothetical protein